MWTQDKTAQTYDKREYSTNAPKKPLSVCCTGIKTDSPLAAHYGTWNELLADLGTTVRAGAEDVRYLLAGMAEALLRPAARSSVD